MGKSFNESVKVINDFISKVFDPNVNFTGITINNPKNLTDQFPFIVTPSDQTYLTGKKFSPTNELGEILEYINYKKFYNNIKLTPFFLF